MVNHGFYSVVYYGGCNWYSVVFLCVGFDGA